MAAVELRLIKNTVIEGSVYFASKIIYASPALARELIEAGIAERVQKTRTRCRRKAQERKSGPQA